MIRNKLNVEQREKAGADTFSKYDFQYHWALYKAMSLTKDRMDYVVMVEMHEDVIIGDSLDGSTVKFEFNQVKTTDHKYTARNLIKQTKSSKGELKSSVLGKLVSNRVKFENPDDVISSYNLVASNGFSLKLKEKRDYNDIEIKDLDEGEVDILTKALKNELSIEELPKNIHFIIPSLPEKGFQSYLIGFITEVMDDVFGTSHKAKGVYLALIDELHRKGQVKLDFKDWDSLKREKAITSIIVERVIQQFVSTLPDSVFQKRVEDYIAEVKKGATYLSALRNEISSWQSERYDTSSHVYAVAQDILSIIKKYRSIHEYPSLDEITQHVWSILDDDSKLLFSDNQEPKYIAAVICECINSQDYGKTGL